MGCICGARPERCLPIESVRDGSVSPSILDGLLQMPSESNMLEMELEETDVSQTLVSLTKGMKSTIWIPTFDQPIGGPYPILNHQLIKESYPKLLIKNGWSKLSKPFHP